MLLSLKMYIASLNITYTQARSGIHTYRHSIHWTLSFSQLFTTINIKNGWESILDKYFKIKLNDKMSIKDLNDYWVFEWLDVISLCPFTYIAYYSFIYYFSKAICAIDNYPSTMNVKNEIIAKFWCERYTEMMLRLYRYSTHKGIKQGRGCISWVGGCSLPYVI